MVREAGNTAVVFMCYFCLDVYVAFETRGSGFPCDAALCKKFRAVVFKPVAWT